MVKECGGTLVGYVDTNPELVVRTPVSASLSKINSVLGLSLTTEVVKEIFVCFGFSYTTEGEVFTVTPPFERPDLVIAEDLIEEIGRIYGYEHVPSIKIEPIPLREVNKRFYYAEAVRDALVAQGFSEIFTSSFRNEDEVKLKNALASDKGYLRSTKGIVANMAEALAKNAPNADLFGTDQIRIFEIGKVFDVEGERDVLVIGAQSKQGHVAKKDRPALNSALLELAKIFGTTPPAQEYENVWSVDITSVLGQYSEPEKYTSHDKASDVTYKPFSNYPYLTRDIAFWTPADTSVDIAEKVIRENAGVLATRIDMFDRFEKEGRVSYGFRIVFQSYEKTLDGTEADALMQTVSDAVRACGWEVR
jgi:phenylalanyl-tRNA synthetase beta subunit